MGRKKQNDNSESDQEQDEIKRQEVKAIRRQKKKQIAKESEELEKMGDKTKTKRGRPPKKKEKKEEGSDDPSSEIDLKYSETDLIKNNFIRYLYRINYKKGLVFTESNRKDLIKEQQKYQDLPAIQWDEQQTWDEQQEKNKAKKLIQQIIKEEIHPDLIEGFAGEILDMSDIFPRQITGEVYRVLCHLYLIALQNGGDKNTEPTASEISAYVGKALDHNHAEYCYFLTGRFSKTFASDSPHEKVKEELRNLFGEIVKYMGELAGKKKNVMLE